ncbi:MAG: hypothetical protein L0H70_08215 [Xanthomonadales bacterium]|nr:hypothetical protein [Xanthomonadales bacterium]
MKHKTWFRLIPAMLLLLLLSACSSKSSSPISAPADANKTPADAVTSIATLLKVGNIDGFLKASLPQADYQSLRKELEHSEFKTQPVTAEDRAKFAAQMGKLTAPDAEATLFQQVQPMLAQFESKYRAQLPMYLGMGQTMATNAINKSITMTEQEKTQAKTVVQQLAQWVQTTNWGDQAKAKQAIAIVVDTARKLDIKTIDQARALTYDQAMGKYSQVWGAGKQVLALYGLDLNKVFDSVSAKTLSSDANKANVAYTYTLFDQPITGQVDLVQRDGHWYNPKFIDQVKKSLAESAASAASASSTAH